MTFLADGFWLLTAGFIGFGVALALKGEPDWWKILAVAGSAALGYLMASDA